MATKKNVKESVPVIKTKTPTCSVSVLAHFRHATSTTKPVNDRNNCTTPRAVTKQPQTTHRKCWVPLAHPPRRLELHVAQVAVQVGQAAK